MEIRILIVEDELITMERIRDTLAMRGFDIAGTAASAHEALAAIGKNMPDLILMDIKIKGGMDGIELTRTINAQYDIPVIFLTAFADRETVERAKDVESYGYLVKPFGEIELVTNIEIALHKHKLDRKLRESEARYRTLFETMRDAVYMHDMSGKITGFNPALESMFGYSRDEVFAINVRDVFVDSNDPARFLEQIKKHGFVKDFAALMRRKDGEIIHCLVTANLERSPDDNRKIIRGIVRDITEKEKARQALQEERDFIEAVLDSLPTIFYAVNREGRLIRWNRKLEDLYGTPMDKNSGINVLDAMNSLNRQIFALKIEEGFNRGSLDFEVRLRQAATGGDMRDFLLTGRRVEIGGAEYLVGSGLDITERKQAETALRISEEKYRRLVENLNDVIFTLNWDGVITYMSPALGKISRFRPDDVVGTDFRRLIHPDDLPGLADGFKRTLSGDAESIEFRVVDKDGSIRHVRTSCTMNIADGSPTGLTGIMSDITDRKKIEEELRESELRYRAIFNDSLNLVYIHDLKGRFLDANDAALSLLGYDRKDIPSLSFQDILEEDELPLGLAQIAEIVNSGKQNRITEFRLKTRSGGHRTVEASASLLYRKGEPFAILGVARDVTERKRFIEEMKYAYAENRYILNSITSILIGVSTTDMITHWNSEAENIFGISSSQAIGQKITGFDINWDWSEIYTGISNCIIEKSPVNLSDIRFTDKNGRKGLLGITINPIYNDDNKLRGFLIFGKDITERRLVEQQLLQSSKMATVGEMATGVAHELNQPLNIIKMASQFMLDGIKEKYATEDFLRERTEKIVAQVDRAAHIINHLREFGRKSDYDFARMDPNEPIRVAFDMLGEQLRLHSIEAEFKLEEGLPLIKGDLSKLEQVFINLIVNAKDALEEMKNSLHDKKVMVTSHHDKDKNEIMIQFSDNGPGIPDDIRERIFEPFFTTKEVGKGTGLGLSISYGIIKAHHGSIEAASGADGTVFTIMLPVDGGRGEDAE